MIPFYDISRRIFTNSFMYRLDLLLLMEMNNYTLSFEGYVWESGTIHSFFLLFHASFADSIVHLYSQSHPIDKRSEETNYNVICRNTIYIQVFLFIPSYYFGM